MSNFAQSVYCRECGKEFIPQDRTYRKRLAKFCSLPCFYLWSRKQPKKAAKCKHCQDDFDAAKGFGKSRQFCTRKCLMEHRGSIGICRACEKEFRRPPSYAQAQVYCSMECHRAHRHKVNTPKPCLFCKKKFIARKASATVKRKFCSIKCCIDYQHKFGAIRRTKRFFSRCQDRGPDWRKVAGEVRRAFEYHCIVPECGMSLQKRADVDHIVPYRLILKLLEKNPALNPNDKRNLVPMCKCHHLQKTGIETRLFRGDVTGFLANAARLIDTDRLQTALEIYGLLGNVA